MSIFERYTETARRTMHLAKCEADGFGSLEVGPEHILLALLSDPAFIGGIMEGVYELEIRAAINAHFPTREPNPLPHDLPLSAESRTALSLATEEADKLSQRRVRNEHVLLGLAQSESYAGQLLRLKGVSADKLRLQIKALPEANQVQEPKLNSKEIPVEARKELETIRRVGEFVSRGERRSALQVLDDFMAEPGQDRKLRMRLLGHFAAVTATQIGDLKTAQRYCEERLSYTPQDPMALFALADCLARQGETEEAGRRAAECHRAALSQGDERGKGILELVERRFPELKGTP